MSEEMLQGVVNHLRRDTGEPRRVTVELFSGVNHVIDNVVDDTFYFFPVPNQPGQNFVALVLTDVDGTQYKYPMAAVCRWVCRPLGN